MPGVLQHLVRLSASFTSARGHVLYLHCYARPHPRGNPVTLKFIRAAESGPEGIACVDDAARAVLLALEVYQTWHVPATLRLAEGWLEFIAYMQEPDGRFTNFILDRAGRKNRRGRTSYPGGQWWAARAAWALAAGWRLTGQERYLHLLQRTRLASTPDLKVTAVQALALLDLYMSQPTDALRHRITALCDRIVAAGQGGYLRDRKGRDEIKPWGYHQLQALARSGHLLSRLDYLVACERTVAQLIEPLIARKFAPAVPWQRAPQCVYDISTIMLGLEELFYATHKQRYRTLALACADWLYGHNPSGTALYDPRTGSCSDGITDGRASVHCGAESAIEAGFIELARRRLWQGQA